jgi:hypothetical protein
MLRAVTYLLTSEAGEKLVKIPVRFLERYRREQYLAVRKPCSGLDNQIANHPCLVVEIKIRDVT